MIKFSSCSHILYSIVVLSEVLFVNEHHMGVRTKYLYMDKNKII